MAELTPADRVIALMEWGDVPEADAEIEEAPDGPDDWQAALWRAMRASMEGRFETAARLAADSTERAERAGDPRPSALAALLVVASYRDQLRLAEGESALRALLERHPSAPASAHALLALIVGEMGRDTQARQELGRLLPRDPAPATGRLAFLWLLAELAVAVEAAPDDLDLLYRRLTPQAGDCAIEDGGAVFYGSVSYALGRLAQARGRDEQAIDHYDAALAAHQRAGAVLLLAHTQRQLATLLRTRGGRGDWERAVALLAQAVNIYRHLGIDGLAAELQGVLARSEDGLADRDEPAAAAAPAPVFRRDGDVWMVGTAGDAARLRDAKGLRDIARLLAAPRASVHVADLLLESASTATPVATGQPWSTMAARPWSITTPVVDAQTRHEYESRLTELASELVEAQWEGNAIRAALARVERDVLHAALDTNAGADPVELARRTVGARIRISLERIEQAQPSIGRHLRTSIRTGTFCSYEPDRPLRWEL